MKDISNCDAFSHQIDESCTDIREIIQSLAFIQMIFEGFNIKEKLLEMSYLKGGTVGQEIFNSFYASSQA